MNHETLQSPAGVQPSESIWSGPRRLLTIGLVLVVVGSAFEALAVATTLPATTADLGGLALYGWAFSAYMLTNLIGITVAGAEADRQGPARPFIVGVILFAVGLLIAGFAPTMAVVIAGRAVQGIGAGTVSSVAYVAIGRGYPESAKPRMLAVVSSAWVVPGLIGPALAGLIADYAGWRWVFLGLAPLPLLAAGMALPALRRIQAGDTVPRDWSLIGASVRLAFGLGLILTGISLSSPVLAGLLLIAGAILAIPALRRLLPPGTLRAAPGLPAAIATMAFVNLAFFGADAFVPLMLTAIRGQTATVAGLALTAATVCWTTGAWVQAHLAARQKRRRLVLIGLALLMAAILGMLLVLSPEVPVLAALLLWGLAGLGMGLAFSTISLVVLETAPPGREGSASAAMQLANVLGVALGAGVGGALIAATSVGGQPQLIGIGATYIVMAMAAVLAVLVARRMPRRG